MPTNYISKILGARDPDNVGDCLPVRSGHIQIAEHDCGPDVVIEVCEAIVAGRVLKEIAYETSRVPRRGRSLQPLSCPHRGEPSVGDGVQTSAAHTYEALSQHARVLWIVGDGNHSHRQDPLQVCHLMTQISSKLSIKAREWFIKQ